MIEILESNAFAPANRMALDAWVNQYGLRITTLVDRAGAGTVTLRTYGIRESVFLVDLATMRVVRKFNGSVAGVGDSAIRMAIPEFLTLLRSR